MQAWSIPLEPKVPVAPQFRPDPTDNLYDVFDKLQSVSTNSELIELIEQIRSAQTNLELDCVINPAELDAARSVCEMRIVDIVPDDFMSRLQFSQAEAELETEEKLKAKR